MAMNSPYRTPAHIERAKALRRNWWNMIDEWNWYDIRSNVPKPKMIDANIYIDQTETD
jgi:hypothetical protein